MSKKKLKKRADGRYRRSISTQEGIVYVYGYTEKELNDNYIETQIKLKKGIKLKGQNILFGDYAVKWFYVYKSMKSEKTKDMYLNVLENHIDSIADIRICDITQDDIQTCINECWNHPNQCSKLHMTLNQIFKSAIRNQLITFNPAFEIDLPNIPKSKKARDLTEIERNALYNADLSPKVKTYLFLGAFCGLRKSEILGLSKSDFNFENNYVHIENVRETSKKIKARIKPLPKTDSSIRNVILIDIVKQQVLEYINSIDTHYLFTMKDGNLMSESSYKKFWAKCKRELNTYFDEEVITSLTSHMLRHEYATNLFYAKVDELEAKDLMGHADIVTTRKMYTHIREKNREADKKLNDYINKQIESDLFPKTTNNLN